MTKKRKPLKIVISKQVTKKMATLPAKDQKKLLKAMKRIAKNPAVGKPFDPVEIKAWPNEVCDCGVPYRLFWDQPSDEIHFMCRKRTRSCDDSFWMTGKELKAGRKKFLKKIKALKAEAGIEYKQALDPAKFEIIGKGTFDKYLGEKRR